MDRAADDAHERVVLRDRPYDRDPDLVLPAPDVDAVLPYGGNVPEEVLRLALQRRARQR